MVYRQRVREEEDLSVQYTGRRSGASARSIPRNSKQTNTFAQIRDL